MKIIDFLGKITFNEINDDISSNKTTLSSEQIKNEIIKKITNEDIPKVNKEIENINTGINNIKLEIINNFNNIQKNI